MAQEKVDRIDEILSHVKEKDHLIVYCGDGKLFDDNNEEIRHINFAKRALLKRAYKPSQFTASENMAKRMELVEMFNEGSLDALVAIRCLDEGINIPSITGALILSSNDDYREFVQRRGRILRTYGSKESANIYDVIVLPSVETDKMAEIELRRFYEYARLAENKDELLHQLENLADDYGLDLDTFVTTFDEEKEADLDD
jgi:superfamily II DNA or RNA helicase